MTSGNPFGAAATATADPFGGKDPFRKAKATFAGILDIEGCLALFYPLEHLRDLPSNIGDPYDAVVCDIVVLDGEPKEAIEYDALPHKIRKMRVVGSAIVPQLTPDVPDANGKGGGMVLGRVTSYKSERFKKGAPGAKLTEPTEEDAVVARKYLADQLLAAKPE
jgi:hypothetical protein